MNFRNVKKANKFIERLDEINKYYEEKLCNIKVFVSEWNEDLPTKISIEGSDFEYSFKIDTLEEVIYATLGPNGEIIEFPLSDLEKFIKATVVNGLNCPVKTLEYNKAFESYLSKAINFENCVDYTYEFSVNILNNRIERNNSYIVIFKVGEYEVSFNFYGLKGSFKNNLKDIYLDNEDFIIDKFTFSYAKLISIKSSVITSLSKSFAGVDTVSKFYNIEDVAEFLNSIK